MTFNLNSILTKYAYCALLAHSQPGSLVGGTESLYREVHWNQNVSSGKIENYFKAF